MRHGSAAGSGVSRGRVVEWARRGCMTHTPRGPRELFYSLACRAVLRNPRSCLGHVFSFGRFVVRPVQLPSVL